MIFACLPALALALLSSQEVRQPAPLPADTGAPPALVAEAELRLYDVSQLTGAARLRELVDGLRATADPAAVASALERLDGLDDRRTVVRSTTNSLLAAIRERIEPSLGDGAQLVLSLGDGRIALVGTPEQHVWLSEFLATASGFDGFIDVQARLFVLDEGRLAELSQLRSGEVLDRARTEELLARLRGLGVETVTAPRIAALPFQQASLSLLDQVAYIKDYELKVLPGQSSEVVDPVVDVVEHGVQLEIRAAPLAGERMNVSAKLEFSHLEEPIPTHETRVGAMGKPLMIQVPRVTRVTLEGSFDLNSGETLLLATADPTGEKEILVLMQATLLRPEPETGR